MPRRAPTWQGQVQTGRGTSGGVEHLGLSG